MLSIADNLTATRQRMADACAAVGRSPDEVTLVAVSKRQPDERLLAAYEAGQRDFGENYVQELLRKRALLPEDARWHLIGHLQTNKAKQVIGAHLIHTVDSIKVANALEKSASAQNITQDVLIEVNLAGEASKAGVAPDALFPIIELIEGHAHLRLRGLMCIPPVGDGKRYFSMLRAQRDALQTRLGRDLDQLSMGMSSDYADAIAEGATIVRVGTAIFGARAS
ncbi:MAG: YggS family pyridoxal phosphate-dependent enzyme [Myxococcota bacterium]